MIATEAPPTVKPAQAEDAVGLVEKGESLLEKEDYNGAVAAFTNAIRLSPKSAEVYCQRGVAYGSKGEPDKAIADFDEAIHFETLLSGNMERFRSRWPERQLRRWGASEEVRP
jgi:Flp pilus assembly protein TadD